MLAKRQAIAKNCYPCQLVAGIFILTLSNLQYLGVGATRNNNSTC
ncbi:hypothetical protein COO91_08675 [Nostoc flagelliforme CCNUN1]|uniref:Uncharacterized protein n=1 Tax=Nostoc flagelliforme CCNUN1 TaxID=2038116 RepID=A0A2K8T665_9NOSO|nr:hypothetical protein COO91_08675 [Nostoc flagelliforme CCNUN1]